MSVEQALCCGVKTGDKACGKPAKAQLFVWAYRVGAIEPFPVVLPVFVCQEHATKDVREACFEKNPVGFKQVQHAINQHDYEAHPQARIGMVDRARCVSRWQPIEGGTYIPEENPGTKIVLSDEISKLIH